MREEMQLVEWKSSWRDEWLQWICGYANAQGGVLEIGKNDEGEVIGIEGTKKLLEDIPNKIKNSLGIIADVNLKYETDLPYISIHVHPYAFPISYHGKYHYRSGSTKQELTGRALDEFMLRKIGKTWDNSPCPLISFEDLEQASFDAFREKALASGRLSETDLNMSNLDLLKSLKLVDKEYLRNAAVLLFAADPDNFIPGSYVKIGYFESGADLVYQDEIHGSLVTITDTIIDLLYTKYFKGLIRYEGIQRVDAYPVNVESAREAILNSLIHKDYTRATPVQIKVFPDKVFIFNPGKLPEGWTVETLFDTHCSSPRNPSIASAIFRTGMIEAWGRGIEKMVEGCRKIGAPDPVIKQLGGDMSIEFIAPKNAVINGSMHEPVDATAESMELADTKQDEIKKPIKADKKPIKADKSQSNREQTIIDYLEEHGEVSNKEARLLLNLAESTTKRLLSSMATKGSIEAIGDRKNRRYRLPE